MRREYIAAVFALMMVAGLMSGCKDGVPQTDLDLFIARTSEIEGAALEDTLRKLSTGEAPYNSYANFILGNRFYATANDSALAGGWSNPGAQSLLDSAEVYFNLAVAQDSTFLEPMVNLGSIWDDRAETMGDRQQYDERIAQANKFYSLALDIDPSDEKARCNLGSLYLRQRRTAEAMAEFKKALEYNPESSLAHYNIAIMFAEAKIYREALAEWELASKYDPDGDIGDRSRANIKIVNDLMNAPTPPIGH